MNANPQPTRKGPAGMSIEVTRDGDPLVLTIRGECGVHETQQLERELTRAALRRPKLAVLDLCGLTFIASLGMGTMLKFRRELERHEGVVRLAGCQGMVLDALQRACLDHVFHLAPSLDAALAAK